MHTNQKVLRRGVMVFFLISYELWPVLSMKRDETEEESGSVFSTKALETVLRVS